MRTTVEGGAWRPRSEKRASTVLRSNGPSSPVACTASPAAAASSPTTSSPRIRRLVTPPNMNSKRNRRPPVALKTHFQGELTRHLGCLCPACVRRDDAQHRPPLGRKHHEAHQR